MWFHHLFQDLRFAWRGLRQSPAFAATAVLTLAVGLGLVTVAFSIFNAYVLRPFAVRDPSGLHSIEWRSRDGGGRSFRWRDYEEFRDRRDLFDAVIAEHTRFVSSTGRPLAAGLVSGNYFDALGVRVLLGRTLAHGDTGGLAGDPAAVLSHQAWVRLFARDPAVVGRRLDLNGRAFVIVGVLGPEFSGLDDSPRDLWVPLTTYAALEKPDLLGPNQPRQIEIIARLRTGVTAAHAQSALTPSMGRVVDGQDDVRAEVVQHATPNRLSLGLLAGLSPIFAAFVLVLVTACANVSNVLLARGLARQREIGLRLSLGASRSRVVQQLLTEGLLIALLAGVAALALAAWALRGATLLLFGTLPRPLAALLRVAPIDVDHRVLVFALAVAAAATLMFALVPALQASRVTLTDALRAQSGGSRRGSRLRSLLVSSQVAVSLVLVIVALTLARNGAAIGNLDLGFEPEGVVSVNVRGQDDGRVGRLASLVSSDPRVAEVAVTGGNPLFVRSRTIAAAPVRTAVAVGTRYTFVSADYFSILRIPIVGGRGFRDDEARSAARVAIVSTATARAFWPGADPIGQTIRIERPEGRPVDELPGYADVIVVGVAGDVVSGMMFDGHDTGHIYLPTSAGDARAVALLMRGRSAGDLGADTLERIFKQVDSDPQVFEALPLEQMVAVQMYPLLAASWIGSLLGAVALALSVSGLYGVLTYMLGQRTKEIGIRMALGATAGAVVRLVMRQSARLAGLGAIVGVAVAFGALKMLSAVIQLRTVTLVDVVAFGGGLALVLAATALAAYYPARRATRVEPAQTLRADA